MPSSAVPGAPIAPPVRVQVLDLAGAPVAGAAVTLSLGNPVRDASLSGNLAATGVDRHRHVPGPDDQRAGR